MIESKQNRLEWLPEWQKKIIRKYPILYLETSPEHSKDSGELPDDHCNLRYGFECEAGWEKLIDELSATGEALVKALRAFNFQDDARLSGFIIKEKFGLLYWQGHDNLLPPFRSLWWGYISSIRERSSHTCEKSGKFGELRKVGTRFQTLSPAEYQKALKSPPELSQ